MPEQIHSYTATAKLFHWLMAALIISASIIGLYGALGLHYGVDAAQDALKVKVITTHKNIATTTLFLIVARLAWRLSHRPPQMIGMSAMMAKLAHAGHWLLYGLMVAVPVSGWANSSSAGYPIPVAWLFEIPRLLEKDKSLTPTLSAIHEYLSWFLLAVVVGHVAFALKHKFIDRDTCMESMLPVRK